MKPATADTIRARFVEYLQSKEFDPVYKRLNPPPKWRYLLAIPFALSGAGLPFAIGLVISARISARERKKERQELVRFAERATTIMTYPVMVNRALLNKPDAIAPGLVLGAFDPSAGDDMPFMADLVMTLCAAETAAPDGGPDAELVALMADQIYTPDRRRRLPKRLTGGKAVYAFDLMIVGSFLADRTLETPLIPCLAEPGPQGKIVMLPAWIVGGALDTSGPDDEL